MCDQLMDILLIGEVIGNNINLLVPTGLGV